MAQDAEPESGAVDPSHEMDLVTLFRSSNHDAEMEALAIQGILEASGIPAIVVGTPVIPSLEFQVQVPRTNLEEAQRAVDEAKAAGPQAAADAEAASEGTI